MTDDEFLMSDYTTQLDILHEWNEWNELKKIMHKAGVYTRGDLVSALKISKVKPRVMTIAALLEEKEKRNK